jgi:tetratricopeptide (TPR) repeat protein
MNTNNLNLKKRGLRMVLRRSIIVFALIIFSLSVFVVKYSEADGQSGKESGLLNMSLDEYKEKVIDEKKILDGLKKLLEIKQHESLSDEGMPIELDTNNEKLFVNKRTSDYGTVLYSIKADLVSIDEILQILVSTSGKKIIIDEDIDKEELYSVISIYLKNTPLVDIIDIILGAKGFETIISEGLIFVTLPTKLNVVSSYGYYQEKAIQAYQKAMIKYPDYEGIVRAYYELGDFYLTSKFPSIALQEYKAVVANYPDHALAKKAESKEGKCYEMLDDLENAKKSYLNYVQKYPLSPDVDDTYLIISDLWRKQGEHEKAIEIYHYVIKEYHDRDTVMLAYMQLGNTYLDSGDYSSALQTFLSMKGKFQSESHESDLLENTLADTTNDIQDSRRLILPDALRYELEYKIGNCYYLLGKYNEAILTLHKFVFYEKENEMLDDAYYKLADCFFKTEDFLTSFQLYKGALTEYSESRLSPHGFLYSGKSLRQMNMLGNAIEVLNQGLVKHQDSVYVESMKLEIGLCYLDDENFNRALDTFEELAEGRRDKNVTVKANIYAGICLESNKQSEKAIEYYHKALNVDTSVKRREWVSKLIGNSYSELGLFADAVKAYQQGI